MKGVAPRVRKGNNTEERTEDKGRRVCFPIGIVVEAISGGKDTAAFEGGRGRGDEGTPPRARTIIASFSFFSQESIDRSPQHERDERI